MTSVELGFKAYDLHELACHFVAEHAGLYRERELEVTLRDTRGVSDDQLPDSLFSAACGAALFRKLGGALVRVEVVASTRPMFWLHANPGVHVLDDLRERTIATYPTAAPPAQFLEIVLEDAGLTPGIDVTLVSAPDDAARIELLRRREADAALVSSAILPHRVKQLGFRELSCLGDRLRLPTTGLAVSLMMVKTHPRVVAAMADACRAALRLAHVDEALLHEALRGSGLVDSKDVGHAAALVRKFFTEDGRVAAADVRPGVRRVAASLGVDTGVDPDALLGALYGPAMR